MPYIRPLAVYLYLYIYIYSKLYQSCVLTVSYLSFAALVVKSFSRDRNLVKTSSLSDDEPLYDSVASDEDYASIGDCQSIKEEVMQQPASQQVRVIPVPTSV